MNRYSQTILLCVCWAAIGLGGCEPKEEPKPDPPTGSLVYGGPGDEMGSAIISTPDGGLLLAGGQRPDRNDDWDAYYIKTDAQGTETFSATQGHDAYDEIIRDIALRPGGGYALAGIAHADQSTNGYVILLDPGLNMETEWRFVLPATISESTRNVEARIFPSTAGGWIFLAIVHTSQILIHLGDQGQVLSTRVYTATTGYYDQPNTANNFAAYGDSGFVFVRYNQDFYYYTSPRLTVTYMFPDGSESYTNEVLLDSAQDYTYYHVGAVLSTADGNIVVPVSNLYANQWLVKFNSLGQRVWQRSIDNSAFYTVGWERANQNLVFAGTPAQTTPADKSVVIAERDSSARAINRRVYGTNQETEYPTDMTETSTGRMAVFGTTFSYGAGGSDMYLIFQN